MRPCLQASAAHQRRRSRVLPGPYAVKIAHHADGGLNHDANLGLAFGPGFHHELALPIDIPSHIFEALDDGFDSLLKPRTGQILIDLISLGLLPSLRCACAADPGVPKTAERRLIRSLTNAYQC